MKRKKKRAKTTRGIAAKYERCVRELKERPGVANPWAVCRAQMNRTYGKEATSAAVAMSVARRRNPKRKTIAVRPTPVREAGVFDPLRALGVTR